MTKTIWSHFQEIKANLNKIGKIALQPKIYTDEDFYNEMIQ